MVIQLIQDIIHQYPIIISLFDAGNGKALVCPRCKGIDYEVTMERKIARLIKLEDSEHTTDNADISQDVILYDDMVENLTHGELVQIEGNVFVERRPGSAKNSKMDNKIHATSIKYLKKKEIIIEPEDIEHFKRWIEISNLEYIKELKLVEQYKRWSQLHNCGVSQIC